MSFWTRLATWLGIKANKALDKVEDTGEMLDNSYNKQLEMLTKVRRGVADVATSAKRVELQQVELDNQIATLTSQAQRALVQNREDLAREALTRKSALVIQRDDLQTQLDQLNAERDKLVAASTRLQSKVDAFRTKKETIKATYSAADAQVRINEAFTGLSDEMGDAGAAIQRAEDKTLQLQARASAVDELLASGVLDDPTSFGNDDITRQLNQLASDDMVEKELAALKANKAIEA